MGVKVLYRLLIQGWVEHDSCNKSIPRGGSLPFWLGKGQLSKAHYFMLE